MSVPDDKVLVDFLSFSTRRVDCALETVQSLELSLALALSKIRGRA